MRLVRHPSRAVWVLALLLAAPVSAVYYLGYTPGGLQLIARVLQTRIGALHFRIDGASGTLARGLHIDRLVVDRGRVQVEVDEVSGRIEVLPLLWRTLHIPQASAARVLVRVRPGTNPHPHPGGGIVRFLPPLMRIVADQLQARRWQLVMPDGYELDTRNVSASGTVDTRSVHVYAGALELHGFAVQLSGEARAGSPLGVNAAVHLAAQPRGAPAWTVDGRVDGTLRRLGLRIQVTEPFLAAFRGEALDLTRHWHWRGAARLMRLDLGVWHAGRALGPLSGTLQLAGQRRDFTARGTVTAPGLRAGAMQTEFRGSLRGDVLSIARWNVSHAASGASAVAAGSVAFLHGGPRLNLHGSWQNFRWPLERSNAPIHSASGTYQLTGRRPFAVTADGQLQTEHSPLMQVHLVGTLSGTGLQVAQARVGLLGGEAQLQGAARWALPRHWQLAGHVDALNVAQLRPRIPGRVSFDLAASGDGFNPGADLQVSVSDLKGRIRGQPAAGHASLRHSGSGWRFNDVRLQLGDTHLAASGLAGSTLDLHLAVTASDLALWHRGARGRLRAVATLSGTLSQPVVKLSAQARDVRWGTLRLSALSAAVNFDPRGPADTSLQLTGLHIGDRTVNELSLRTRGSAQQHRVVLAARAQGLRLGLLGSGSYRQGAWTLAIRRLYATGQPHLNLTLMKPAEITLAPGRMTMSPLCLHDGPARVCASGNTGPARRTLSVSATDLPLRALTAGLTPSTEFDGTVQAKLSLSSAASDQPWLGSFSARLSGAAVRKHLDNGRVESLELGDGRLEARLTAQQLTGSLMLDAGAAARIKGRLDARGSSGAWPSWPLAGSLSVDTDALGFLGWYVPQVDRASGEARARLTLGGTAGAPQLSGMVALSNAQIDSYVVNLALRHVNIAARLSNDAIALSGSADAGPHGHASLSGHLRWRGGQPYGDLHLQGTNLRMVNIPEAQIDASPDVTLRMDGRRIDVVGRVTLPYANIRPANLTNAVLPSSDEVIVGPHTAPPGKPYQVYSHVRLQLGRRVSIDTHGLSGRLSGNLTVVTDSTGIDHGTGELKIQQGRYLAYGRNLQITQGRLIFDGGVLSDPGLELRAEQQFPDITAGVNVRGTLSDPTISFFSNPPVSQSQIVSLLLAGGSLATAQNAGSTGSNSRADMLMQGGAILAQQLVGRFGIDAGVQQDLSNQTSLVLGRYLSPRLYVSYGVGLATAINTFKMRYTIGDHWTIDMEAGTRRSADLVYTFRR